MENIKLFFNNNLTTILFAISIFVIGFALAKFIKKISIKIMVKASFEKSVVNFLSQVIYILSLTIVIIATLAKLGAPTHSLLAVLSTFGLAIGLAIKDTISNFASGIILLIFKPFKVDDYININTKEGTVLAINIMTTEIMTKDNKKIFIPNSMFTQNTITNFSCNKNRKIQLIVDIAYDADHKKAMKILKEIFLKDERIINRDNVEIGLFNFAASSVQIVCYPEFKTEDYWPVYYHLLEEIKLGFDKNGIEIPFTNQTIHVKNID